MSLKDVCHSTTEQWEAPGDLGTTDSHKSEMAWVWRSNWERENEQGLSKSCRSKRVFKNIALPLKPQTYEVKLQKMLRV